MNKPDKRSYYLDNLKVLLTIFVVFHHAGQAYGDGGGWPYAPSLTDEYAAWFANFFPVNAAFFMGLYFMISAYFVPRSLEKSGTKQFIRKKFMRLGIPMLAIVLVLSFFTSKVEFAHTWFLEHLLFYTLVYVCVAALCRKSGWKITGNKPLGFPLLIALAILLSVVTYYVRLTKPIDHWEMVGGFLSSEPAHLPQYVLLFVVGIVAWRKNWFETLSPVVGKTLLAVGVVMALMVYSRLLCPFLRDNIWWNWYWYESVLCLCLCFGLIYLFREKVNGTSRFRQWLADQSYAVYIFHVFILVALQFAFDKVDMGGGTMKFLFIGLSGTIVSFLVAYLVRCIPGMKRIL